MSNKGNNRHVKRLAAGNYMKISKKTSAYVAKPKPGRHTGESSIALVTVLTEKLNLAATKREVKEIMRAGNIYVNGKVIKEEKYPIGYGDSISMKDSGEHFIVDAGRYGTVNVKKSEKKEHSVFKVIGKYVTKGGKEMIRIHDGRTTVAQKGVNVNDSVLLDDNMKIKEILKFKVGAKCEVYKGVHAPTTGEIKSINAGTSVREQSVEIKGGEGVFETVSRNVIIVGA